MLLPRFVASIISVGMMVPCAGLVFCQEYPNRPIRIITSAIGGGSDFMARLIAQGLTSSLGWPVVVDNRAGGSAITGEVVAKVQPDGYILLGTSSSFWVGPLLKKVPYDPVRDFSPISLLAGSPNVLIVHPSLPVKSVKELIALAKARPGELNYATGSLGASNHLAAELFKALAGVNMVRIAYKGGGPALNDLIGGQVQLLFASIGSVGPHVKVGRLRALAVTGAEPSALFPGLPTIAASGLPGYEMVSTEAIFGPDKTPATIIRRLNQEIVRLINMTDMKERLFNSGLETVGSSPEQLAVAMKSEMTTMAKVIRDAGIREE